jgi:ABC-type branched-subunit amino acid transport system substrate-binding protein
MRTRKYARAVALLGAAVVVAATGCSTKADSSSSSGGGGSSGDVTTDVGVEGNTITLGVLTDLTGVFAALGKDITNANNLYWQDHKVCDTYDVKLNVQDTGYVPQQGVQLYSSIKDSILAMQQTIGSPINTALAQDYEADQMVNFPSAWGETLTQIPGTGVLGATYDVEISNGYDYLFKQGLLHEGDTVGHIYFEGEYGATGLAGTKKVAEEKGLKVVEAQIKATDQDMSAQISQFAAAGVKLIALTVAPTQTASVAAAAQAQGLDVPILGSNPVYAPGLLAGPTAQWLKDHLYVAAPIATFEKHQDILTAYQKAYPDVAAPSAGGVLLGYGMSTVMNQVLDKACDNGDLTRQGVLDAFNNVTNIDTGGLIVPIEAFKLGRSPSLQSYIEKPADVPGGATLVQDAFEGEFAASLADAQK